MVAHAPQKRPRLAHATCRVLKGNQRLVVSSTCVRLQIIIVKVASTTAIVVLVLAITRSSGAAVSYELAQRLKRMRRSST
jgi:hypothetical protein